MNFTTTIFPFVLVIFSIAICVVLLNLHFHKNLYKEKEKQEELTSNHKTELLRSSILVQEAERKRIAQDLHDELGSTLSIMRMNLVVLEDSVIMNTGSTSISNIRQLTENALTTVRNISHQLMPPQLEKFGLIKTLEAVIQPINNGGNILIQLTSTLGDVHLPWYTNLALYRINMELINNTIKHAKATSVHINISFGNDWVDCYYTDNGIGIVTHEMGSGLGFKSIEGRVTALNGVVKLGNLDQTKGFFAHIQIPL